MTQTFELLQMRGAKHSSPQSQGRTSIYTHPEDVAKDATLTTAEKREILASWISDARAIENAPAWRRLDSGAVVELDEIMSVLNALDAQVSDERRESAMTPRSQARRNRLNSWLTRLTQAKNTHSDDDDDDDPPPAPSGLVIPFRPSFLAAHPARPERELAWAVG